MALTSGNPTLVSLRGAHWWAGAAWLLAAAVVSTAAVAHQHLGSDPGRGPGATVAGEYQGIVRPRELATIAVATPVTVRRVVVSVGEHVTLGQTLVEIDDADARRLVADLTAEIARDRAHAIAFGRTATTLTQSIRELREKLSESSAALAVAQRTAAALPALQWKESPERAQEAYEKAIAHERAAAALAEKNPATRDDLADAQVTVRIAADDLARSRRWTDAQAKLAAAEREHARLQTELAAIEQQQARAERDAAPRPSRMSIDQRETALEEATARLTDSTIRAGRAGVVATVSARSGDLIEPGTPLLTLATIDPMIVDISLPASKLDALHRGDSALVFVSSTESAFASEGESAPVPGRIVTIAPLPEATGNHTVAIEFRNPSGALLSGRSARVRLRSR